MAAHLEVPRTQWTGKQATWRALEDHQRAIRGRHLRTLFTDNPARSERMTAEAAGVFLDYSKNRIDDETLRLLIELAEQSELRARIEAMFRGEKINVTEDRSVLHVALRAPREASIVVDGKNVVPKVHAVLDKMAAFAHRIRSGELKGHTGKRIRNVVNIGIGGSDLGPVMAYEALKYYSDRTMTFRFVSNVDGTDFVEATRDLDPAETLFIVSSKTFTTLETMTTRTARAPGRSPASAAMPKPWLSISSRYPQTPKRSQNSASIRPTCSSFGTGSEGATRWIPPSVFPP
jgi:glucose-6-phosphate isomerase